MPLFLPLFQYTTIDPIHHSSHHSFFVIQPFLFPDENCHKTVYGRKTVFLKKLVLRCTTWEFYKSDVVNPCPDVFLLVTIITCYSMSISCRAVIPCSCYYSCRSVSGNVYTFIFIISFVFLPPFFAPNHKYPTRPSDYGFHPLVVNVHVTSWSLSWRGWSWPFFPWKMGFLKCLTPKNSSWKIWTVLLKRDSLQVYLGCDWRKATDFWTALIFMPRSPVKVTGGEQTVEEKLFEKRGNNYSFTLGCIF